jgi:hypothetical protein
MGVKIAGQSLHRGTPFVSGIVFVEGLDLRDEDIHADEADHPSPAEPVQLHASAPVREGQVLHEKGHRAHGLEIAGVGTGGGNVALSHREQALASSAGHLDRG